MNAAFLLVATAWAAGQSPAPKAPTTAPTMVPSAAPTTVPYGVQGAAPIAGGSNGSCCGGGGCGSDCGCNDCCNDCCGKPSFFERLRSRFSKSSCCDSCDTCSSCNTCAASSCGSSCGCGTASSCGCNDCCNDCCGKPSFMDRLRARFSKSSCCDGCDTCSSCGSGCGSGCGGGAYGGGGYGGGAYGAPAGTIVPGAPTTTMPPAGAEKIAPPKDGGGLGQKLPAGTPGSVRITPIVPSVTPNARTFGGEGNSPFELDRRYETRVDRAADYSWVTGQLFYVHADGGLWVLRYAPLSKEDNYGGSVVLARDRQMDSYREGDLVTVSGEIINPKGSVFLGGPMYRAKSIQLIDRSRP